MRWFWELDGSTAPFVRVMAMINVPWMTALPLSYSDSMTPLLVSLGLDGISVASMILALWYNRNA